MSRVSLICGAAAIAAVSANVNEELEKVKLILSQSTFGEKEMYPCLPWLSTIVDAVSDPHKNMFPKDDALEKLHNVDKRFQKRSGKQKKGKDSLATNILRQAVAEDEESKYLKLWKFIDDKAKIAKRHVDTWTRYSKLNHASQKLPTVSSVGKKGSNKVDYKFSDVEKSHVTLDMMTRFEEAIHAVEALAKTNARMITYDLEGKIAEKSGDISKAYHWATNSIEGLRDLTERCENGLSKNLTSKIFGYCARCEIQANSLFFVSNS